MNRVGTMGAAEREREKGYNNWSYSSSSSSSSVSFSGLQWFRAKQDAARNIRGKKIRGRGGAAAGFMFPVCIFWLHGGKAEFG